MATKTEIENIKKFHKDRIREFSQRDGELDMYAYYFFGNNTSRRARCYGDLFGYICNLTMDQYSLAVYPLKFNRRFGYFDYDALFKELNKIYGYYFKIGRYYSGFRYTRLVHINPIKKPEHKALWWGGLYTIYLLLRKINVHYYYDWKDYFKITGRKKNINTWKDIITISETQFGDDGYYLHDDLFKLAWQEDRIGTENWIDNYLNMLNDVFGKGISGDNKCLQMSTVTYNTAAINGLFNFWESAK